MRQRVVGWAGPPFWMLAKHLAQDSEFVSGTGEFLELPEDSFIRVRDVLLDEDGFLSSDAVEQRVTGLLDKEVAKRFTDYVRWLSRIIREAGTAAERAVSQLGEALCEHSESVDQEKREVFETRVRQLIVASKGLDLQHKAETLVGATGASLAWADVYCDVRPIFNEDRTEVRGAIPLSVLRMDYFSVSGDTETLEVRLTEGQLEQVRQKIESAEKKINVLKKELGRCEVVIPQTSATRKGDDNDG